MTVIGGKGGQIDYDKNAGGSLFNSIILASGQGTSLDLNSTCGDMADAGNLQIRSNVWHLDVDNASVETAAVHGDSADAVTILGSDNYFSNPYLGGANYAVMGSTASSKKRYEVGGVYLKPLAFVGNDATDSTKLEPYIALYFDAVNFMGAFDPTIAPWTDGWTVPSQLGYLLTNRVFVTAKIENNEKHHTYSSGCCISSECTVLRCWLGFRYVGTTASSATANWGLSGSATLSWSHSPAEDLPL